MTQYEAIKSIIDPILYDKNGHFAIGRFNDLNRLMTISNGLYHYVNDMQNAFNISISECIYLLYNVRTNCISCDDKTDYIGFSQGYKKTCGNKKCLSFAYGINPHILTVEERATQAQRMTKNNPMFNTEYVRKRSATVESIYGDVEPFHYPKNKEKSLNTRYDKYGTFSPKHTLFKTKEYIFPSGKTAKVQGYEPLALNFLLTKYHENDILICGRSHVFKYFFGGRMRKYYPDLYIKSTNTYIEVKSTYTYNVDLNKNMEKQKAVERENINFVFLIVDSNKNITTSADL
jgi:hypothetical protein